MLNWWTHIKQIKSTNEAKQINTGCLINHSGYLSMSTYHRGDGLCMYYNTEQCEALIKICLPIFIRNAINMQVFLVEIQLGSLMLQYSTRFFVPFVLIVAGLFSWLHCQAHTQTQTQTHRRTQINRNELHFLLVKVYWLINLHCLGRHI